VTRRALPYRSIGVGRGIGKDLQRAFGGGALRTSLRGFAGEDREENNAEVHYRIEMVACRDKLDLDKPGDRVAAQD
jgi:hypothetical protein